jgi:tRNA threonylcarbamoyladenosine biosynthesis protein TsaB
MLVLAIDTAGSDCSACIYDSAADKVLGVASENIGKGHAERLMGMIDAALSQAGIPLNSVERIAVTVGPGSFTGIRVGVAAARGFALSLGIDAVGVTTLEVLAASSRLDHPGAPVTVAMDAKRNEVYLQAFNADGSPRTEPLLALIEDAITAFQSLGGAAYGSGAPLLQGSDTGAEKDRFQIGLVAKIGAAKPSAAPRPKPLYLRGPDAKPQTGFALERRALA